MITMPYQTILINAYFAASASVKPEFKLNINPLLARSSILTEAQSREADRLRKAYARKLKASQHSFDDAKFWSFVSEMLNHVSVRSELDVAARPNVREMQRDFRAFLDEYKLSFDDFAKYYGGLSSFLLGLRFSRLPAKKPRSDASYAAFKSFFDAFSEPQRVLVALKNGEKDLRDIEAVCLEGLPDGTALYERFQSETTFDSDRRLQMAALTGLTWQLALFEATLMDEGREEKIPSLAPCPTDKGGECWSGGPAWIHSVAGFERLHHADQRTGVRGPKSVARQIQALLEKGGTGNASDYKVRTLNSILSGKTPLTFKVVEDICRVIEAAKEMRLDGTLQDARSDAENTSWQAHLLKLRLQGHISGFMGYLERVWAYASHELGQPELLQDLHAVWQDWPRLYKHALDSHRERLAEFGL